MCDSEVRQIPWNESSPCSFIQTNTSTLKQLFTHIIKSVYNKRIAYDAILEKAVSDTKSYYYLPYLISTVSNLQPTFQCISDFSVIWLPVPHY